MPKIGKWNRVLLVGRPCPECKVSFSPRKDSAAKYCSKVCMGKGHAKNYNGENAHNWKGDNVKYQALHKWVRKQLGKPNLCAECGNTNPQSLEWANISKKYKRDILDWKRLCKKCHKVFDSATTPRGEQCPVSKLNSQKVKLIRLLYFDFKWYQRKIAKLFRINQNTAWNAIHRRTWRHVL